MSLSTSCCLVALALSTALTGAVHAAGPKSPAPVKDISGIPDVGRVGLSTFPKMSCGMTKALPKAAARHVSFKLEFGPGKVQQIRFDDPLDWSEEAKSLADQVVAWANDAQEYMACLRTWRNEFITALNPVIGYFNTAQDATASNRHPELELLESPLRDRGVPFAFTCRLPEPLVGEPSALELATFDNCVQRHLDSHDRFIEARKKELADTTRRGAERVQRVE